MLTIILGSFYELVVFATSAGSLTLSLTRIGSIVITTSSCEACGSAISNKVTYWIVMQRYGKYKKTCISKRSKNK